MQITPAIQLIQNHSTFASYTNMPVQEQAIENWSNTSSKEEIKPKGKEKMTTLQQRENEGSALTNKVGIIYHPIGLQNLIRILVYIFPPDK